ncbi:MAG: CinA family protein, partial [Anaerolineae bacterium]|nr:CinA family protein [Anaerolineae bacterium]
GGLVTHRLTNVPGCSEVLQGAMVCYSNTTKGLDLKVPVDLMTRQGAVSSEVALCMARNIRQHHGSSYGIGITGIAGPDGGTNSKPVGLAFVAVASADEAICIKCQFSGDRASVKKQTSTQALKLLYEFIC